MNVNLVKARDTDIESIHKMQVDTFRPLLEKYKDYGLNPACETVDMIRKRYEQDYTDYYLIKLDDKDVGAIRVINKEKSCRISPLLVLPEYQNMGIAQEVFRLIEEKYNHIKLWELDTILEEKGNCYLYEKLGYKEVGERRVVNENMTIIFYEKIIS